jgi:hypothetical protein
VSQSEQQNAAGGRGGTARGQGAKSKESGKAKGGKAEKVRTKSSSSQKNETPERPGASGHRFGPDLACSECGILWDVHQREPKPCKTESANDAFARRPAIGFDDGANSELAEGRGTATVSSADSHGSSDSATDSTSND